MPFSKFVRQSIVSVLPRKFRLVARLFLQLNGAERVIFVRNGLLRLLRLSDDARLPPDLSTDAHVLFLCRGNIYRSPMAAAMFSRTTAESDRSAFVVRSAGLHCVDGNPAAGLALAASKDLGIPLSEHRTTSLTDELVEWAHIIVVMDAENEANVLARFPGARERLVALGAFDPELADADIFIEDPYGQGSEAVATCYRRLARSVAALHESLVVHSFARVGLVRTPLREAGLRLLTAAPARLPFRLLARRPTTIFMLHRFANPDLAIRGHDPALIRSILEYLRRDRFHLASLADWHRALMDGTDLPDRSVIFTVDDGYGDFADVGVPLFADFDCPATSFVVTDPVDKQAWFWWDRIHFALDATTATSIAVDEGGVRTTLPLTNGVERRRAQHRIVRRCRAMGESEKTREINRFCAQLEIDIPAAPPARYAAMTWDAVRKAAQRGATFGAHTLTHPWLASCDAQEVRVQVGESAARLRAETEAFVPVFCYPYGERGSYNLDHRGILSELGMDASLSAEPGFSDPSSVRKALDTTRWSVPRFPLPDDLLSVIKIVSGLERVRTAVGSESRANGDVSVRTAFTPSM